MFESSPQVDKLNPLPRHLQVQQILSDLLGSGRLRPGDKIPAEVEISNALGVSRMTVNKAILTMTAEGFFIRQVGRGTFVVDRSGDSQAADASVTAVARGALEALRRRMPRITMSFVQGSQDILESDYYGTLYRGVMDVFYADGLDPIDLQITPLAVDDFLAEEARAPADGRLIICPRIDSVPSIQQLCDNGKAVVVLGADWPDLAVSSIDSNNVTGAQDAVKHLTDLGHQNIALLYAEEEASNSRDRIEGFRLGRLRNSPSQGVSAEIRAKESWEIGATAHEELISALTRDENPITGIFAAGFNLALEAMNAARDAGLRVPEDVSVIGYDDPITAHLVYPPLTTIRQPLREMGRRAAERLLRRMRDTAESRRVVHESLQSHLIIRGSTAPVRASDPSSPEVPSIMALRN